MGEIAERITTKNKDEKNKNVLTISAQHGLISQLDFFKKSVSSKNLSGYYLLKRDDFAYNKSYSNGYPMGAIKRLTNYDYGVVSTLYICFKFNPQISQSFAEHFFESGKQNCEIEKIAQEGARNHGLLNISVNDFFNISLKIPNRDEQDKIAQFLSIIQDKIETQKKTIKELNVLKTLSSKNIFLQTWKFKDENGNDYPKWENKKLKDISFITMGQSPDSSSYNDENIGVPLLQGNADISNRKSNPRQYTKAPTKLCEIGDILLTVRAPVGFVAKSFHNACIGRGICALKNNHLSLSEFLYQFLLQFENQWKSIEQGSTFTAVNSSDIYAIKIKVPNIVEQEKISNFLSAIDSKIEIENQILEKLNQQKKFFLQNLFI